MRRIIAAGILSLVAVPAIAQKPPKKEQNRISREELVDASAKYSTLYEAIRRLRPQFLIPKMSRGATGDVGLAPGGTTTRDPNDPTGYSPQSTGRVLPVVYVDGRPVGDIMVLKTYQTTGIEEVRLLTQNEALTAFGAGPEGGVIAVKIHLDRQPS